MPHGARVWMVTRYDDVRRLLTDPRVSKDGRRMNEMFARHSGQVVNDDESGDPGFDDELSAHMMNSDPPRHTRLRRWSARPSRPVAWKTCGPGSSS